MAGSVVVVSSVVGITGTTFATPAALEIAHGRAAYVIDIDAISGTWSVTVRRSLLSNAVDLARLDSLTAAGAATIPLVYQHDDPSFAFAEPSEIEYTLISGPGSLTADLVVFYGD